MLWIINSFNSFACINKILEPCCSRLQNWRQTWPVLVAPRPAATSEPSQPLESTDRSQISAATTTDYSIWLIAIWQEYVCIIDSRAVRLHSVPSHCWFAKVHFRSPRRDGQRGYTIWETTVWLSVCFPSLI